MTTTTATTAKPRRGDALVANTVALILGAAAFSVSFTHVMHVAAHNGQTGWISVAIAVSVELLALASVAEIKRRRPRGEKVWPAIVVMLFGVAMSLATNLATAAAGPWGKIMAAWPAISFLAVAALVESRTDGPAHPEGASRTDETARVNQSTEIRTAPAEPAPYGARTESARTESAVRTAVRTEDTCPEPVRIPELRTEQADAEPVRTAQIRTHGAPGSLTNEASAPADAENQSTAAPAPTVEPQGIDEGPQDATPVQDAPAAADTALVQDVPSPATTLAPVAPAGIPALTAASSSDTTVSVSDSILLTPADTAAPAAPLTPVPTSVAEAAPAPAWLPGASGLLLPAGLAAGAEQPVLIVPGRPATVPGPRPTAPSSARTDQARPPRTHTRTERGAKARTGAAPRTDKARTDAPRTDRPARTDVVAELVTSIRTDAEWRPDYEALETRTGYKRSFLEKCVGDARKTVAAA